MIKSISYNQSEIIKNILDLHTNGKIDLDPTYSKGNFYKSKIIPQPKYKSDLYPQAEDIKKCDAAKLWLGDKSIQSIIFDPPFIAGHTKEKPTGIIGERFHGFRYMPDLWKWYDECLKDFYRVLDFNGVLIFKCQDTVSSGKQWLSHVHIINVAETLGFYTKDLFVLVAKNRIVGHNHSNQKHARKFHSYFLVFKKLKSKQFNLEIK
jgi:hypothetical protein